MTFRAVYSTKPTTKFSVRGEPPKPDKMMWLEDSKRHVLDDSDDDSVSSGEEVPIWVRGEQRWVSGITADTTCHDVIQVLLQDEESRGRHIGLPEQYHITERWRGVEQPLDYQSVILDIWNAWGTAQPEVSHYKQKKNVNKEFFRR
jgi:Ras association domain-containing protein 9/10